MLKNMIFSFKNSSTLGCFYNNNKILGCKTHFILLFRKSGVNPPIPSNLNWIKTLLILLTEQSQGPTLKFTSSTELKNSFPFLKNNFIAHFSTQDYMYNTRLQVHTMKYKTSIKHLKKNFNYNNNKNIITLHFL